MNKKEIEIAKDRLDDELGTLYLIDFNKLKISIPELSERQTILIDKYTERIIEIIKPKL